LRHRRSHQWHHALAVARSRCAAPVAPSQLDIPARSAVRAQSRTDPRSLCPSLEGQGAGGARLRSVRRREDQHSGPYRTHPSLPPAPGRPIRVEHEYKREGALAYLAAWDVHRATLFGRCERKTEILPFGRLVAQVMRQKPYRSANRVFLVVDNGSSHRGQRAADRLRARWPNVVLVHTPVHASWLNQIEIYFSTVQRKLLDPNDFECLADVERALTAFQLRYQSVARPFRWTFTRRDLRALLDKLRSKADLAGTLLRRNTST